jgi:iron complex outermembrane receptor protein
VVRGDLVADAGAFNVNRLKEMLPTVQFYSTNARNSSINIRGLGAPFGLTNDGIEPGVGLYIDGVFYARPASASLDFLDVEQVEVLRGPQGTLFGKNTTAGAINITTRKPGFTTGTEVELNYGNIGFVQAKASITGPLSRTVAARLSFSGTQRDGTVLNIRTGDDVNDLNNLGVKGQLLYAPSDKMAITLALDHARQRVEGVTQIVAGIAPTLRPANRQFPQIAADLGYTLPSLNAFDRVTDIDTPMRSYQDLGGASLTVDRKLGPGRLTAITAWRFWDWKPSNDRDFIGLPVTTISSGTSKQDQWTQEVRYAAAMSPRFNFVAGTFFFVRRLIRIPSSSRSRARPPRAFCWRPARTPRLRACSTATASTSRSCIATSAPRYSARSNGRSPIACGCFPGCG